MRYKEEIYPGVYRVFQPDGSWLVVGDGWGTHIHENRDWYSVKIEQTGEHFSGLKPFEDRFPIPDWAKKTLGW